jgi:decaprenyl-phosphate phosphoribosyltransferase
MYALANKDIAGPQVLIPALLAAIAFALASSAMYIFNDLRDIELDKHHPRKKLRPLASGAVSKNTAWLIMGLLVMAAAAVTAFMPFPARHWMVGGILALYLVNVMAYSIYFKHRIVADVMSLSLGFVLRVAAGCAAIAVVPTTFLLNVTFFLAMFLAFGKRLGEVRSLGADASLARTVLERYSEHTLRLAVIATGVVSLVTYSAYIITQDKRFEAIAWPNLLWLTILPATYGLLRAVVLLDRGDHDDPTELALKDRAFQMSALAFGILTAVGLLAPQYLK